MAVIGIDLGTTNSLACVCLDGKVILIPNPLGETLTPSVVSLSETGEVCVGAVAKERLVSRPEVTVSSFKRNMGTNKVFRLGEKLFTPQELSSFVLRRLKEDAEHFLKEEVTEAVISVPAYFNDNQRYATKEAGKLAGLKVERLINEPSAAALAASRSGGGEDQSFLVFDFGGGTLDVSVVDVFENVIEIVAVSGDNRLGGDDFDQIIARRFCRMNQLEYEELEPRQRAALLRQSERCKRELTVKDSGVLVLELEGKKQEMTISNLDLAEEAGELFERISIVVNRALRDSGRTMRDVDEIALAGGSSKMTVLSCYLETLLGRKPRFIGSPDEVVAAGAGIFAAVKLRSEEFRDLVLTDICPFSLGVEVMNRQDMSKPVLSPIIERNSILPASKFRYYSRAHTNQTEITVSIYQGDAYYCQDNLKLGEIIVNMPPGRKGGNDIKICFTYDINGILEVEVTDRLTGRTLRETIKSEYFRMSPQEEERRLEELQAYKLQPPGGVRTSLVMARGERLFTGLFGERRRTAAEMLQCLGEAMNHGASDQEMMRMCRKAEKMFDCLERNEV